MVLDFNQSIFVTFTIYTFLLQLFSKNFFMEKYASEVTKNPPNIMTVLLIRVIKAISNIYRNIRNIYSKIKLFTTFRILS